MTKLDAALAAKLCAEAMKDPDRNSDGRAWVAHSAHFALAEQLMAALDEVSAARAMAMLAPRDMTYQQRSEFERLKHADINQGRRIAELLSERDSLRSTVDALKQECERMRAVYEAAVKWRRAKFGGGWLVGADAGLASTLDAAHVSRERAKEGSK